MKRIAFVLLCMLLVQGSWSQDLESIVEKVHQAIGIDARKSLPNLRMDGVFIMNGTTVEAPYKFVQARPTKLRIETTVMGFKVTQTYNGSFSWLLNPLQGMQASKVDPRDMEFLATCMALDGPFSINIDNKFRSKYFGEEEFEGSKMLVAGWSADEERYRYFIDKDDYLVRRVLYEYKKNGGWYSKEFVIKRYGEFEGGLFPTKIAVTINGVEMLTLENRSFRVLEKMDEARFGKPGF